MIPFQCSNCFGWYTGIHVCHTFPSTGTGLPDDVTLPYPYNQPPYPILQNDLLFKEVQEIKERLAKIESKEFQTDKASKDLESELIKLRKENTALAKENKELKQKYEDSQVEFGKQDTYIILLKSRMRWVCEELEKKAGINTDALKSEFDL